MNKVAILLANYNMPERTDALCHYIQDNVRADYDLIVVDNGSDIQDPSVNSSVLLAENVQTTGAWLMGLSYVDQLALKKGNYFAYWFLITSTDIPEGQGDILTPMIQWLESHPDAVGIHPALSEDSTSDWKQLYARGGNEPRRTWMIDNIASLYVAGWFNNIGRFDKTMRYAWGIDLETCWKARKDGRSLWIDERVQVRKVTNIGYTMNRMNSSAEERRQKASANMAQILEEKYGANWWDRMTNEFVEGEWR